MNYRCLALATLLSALAVPASAKTYCGAMTGAQHDYRVPDAALLEQVNQRYFSEEVENGIRGKSGPLGIDLEQTLMRFPNHYRALNTLLRVAPRYRGGVMPGAALPNECYFERAVRAFPDDSTAWLMYARYQFLMGRESQALSMLHKAAELSPEDATINYNLGLLLARQKKYDEALPFAQIAYAQNFPLPGLKQSLAKAGKWVEPLAPPAAAAAASASASNAPPPAKP